MFCSFGEAVQKVLNEKVLSQIRLGERKILVVGVRHSNIDDAFRADPHLRILYRDDIRLSKINSIPSDTGIILVTRFISHKIQDRLLSVKPPEVEFIKHAFDTGELKRFISKILEPAPESTTVSEQMQQRNERGVVERWIATHINLTVSDFNAECKRLLGKAKDTGLVTSEVYLKRRIRNMWEKSSAARQPVQSPNALKVIALPKQEEPKPQLSISEAPVDAEIKRSPLNVELRGLQMLDDLRELLRVALLEIDVVRAEYDMLKSIAQK